MAPRVMIRFDRADLTRKLRRAQHRARHLGPAFRMIGREAIKSIRKNFTASGRPKKWPRRKPGSGRHKLLLLSRSLRESIKAQVFGDGVEIGSELVYAATHQYGRDAIPARPYLLVQEEDEATFATIIEKYIVGDLSWR